MTTIDDSGRITLDPAVCNGRPVIKGTRIAVQTVLEFLGAGDVIEDVLEEYPALTREDVLACLQFSFTDQAPSTRGRLAGSPPHCG